MRIMGMMVAGALALAVGGEARAWSQETHRRIVLDLSQTHYLSSTAFAVLLGFAKKVEAAGGHLKIAGMQPDVLVGANILGVVLTDAPVERGTYKY